LNQQVQQQRETIEELQEQLKEKEEEEEEQGPRKDREKLRNAALRKAAAKLVIDYHLCESLFLLLFSSVDS